MIKAVFHKYPSYSEFEVLGHFDSDPIMCAGVSAVTQFVIFAMLRRQDVDELAVSEAGEPIEIEGFKHDISQDKGRTWVKCDEGENREFFDSLMANLRFFLMVMSLKYPDQIEVAYDG